mgnify:CR=1 FL=1
MFLRLQMEHVAYRELDVALVSGDRRTLTKEDVSSSGRTKEEGTATQRYAAWLGELHSKAEESRPGSPARDDFVNDALTSNLFGARRYRVKPAVSRVEVTGLVERARDDHTEQEWLDVTLFLEDADGRRFDFVDVGSGLSYLFPIMATLWESKLSWVEQPELHLHPAAQCEIGDMFIRAFNRGRFSIVETHSEHLLLRVLRRIRGTVTGKVEDPELRCPPEAVCVLYFEPTENGTTKVHRLRVSRAGDFMDRWPSGFFEERDRELFDE